MQVSQEVGQFTAAYSSLRLVQRIAPGSPGLFEQLQQAAALCEGARRNKAGLGKVMLALSTTDTEPALCLLVAVGCLCDFESYQCLSLPGNFCLYECHWQCVSALVYPHDTNSESL